MKYYLLLDSSNTSLTVALCTDKLIESISYEAWQSQSEHMIPEINNLLTKYSVDRNDIEGVMVSIGPGSYTGVRIALTIAKTMVSALKNKLYTVSSLQILKDGSKPSICLINARSDRSYIGVYQNEKCLLKDQIMTNDEVKQYIAKHPDYSICGSTKYLQIDGHNADIAKEMFSLLPYLKPSEEPRGVKPVYLKD